MNKEDAYLFGPFVGELYWECYRFAPYAIHLKKKNPKTKMIVFTRPSRFDLYGKYTNIFVPLVLKNESEYKQKFFKLDGFENGSYSSLIRFFRKKYVDKFNIKDHFFPDLDSWRYKVKWQFPRSLMDYDFKPRSENEEILYDYVFDSTNYVVSEFDNAVTNYETFFVSEFKEYCNEKLSVKSSVVGCLILLLKNAKFVIGNLRSFTSKLALLLKTPVILVNERMTTDSISLINPFGTLVIKCESIDEGVDIYENNIRP